MKVRYFFSLCFLILVGVSCSRQEASQKIQALSLSYLETEQGVDPYPVRMLVTDRFLRLDDGAGSTDYLLFNREDKAIYSVTTEDQRVLKIPFRKITLNKASGPVVAVVENKAEDLPTFMNQHATHHSLLVGKNQCYNVVAVAGLYPDAVMAMREYLLTLAGEQAVNLNKTPVDMQEPCMLSNLVFSPLKHLEYGFPLREWDYRGYVRELLNVETVTVDTSLFKVDPTYQVLMITADGLAAADP